jgi:signal transduction histidine kinase
MSVSGAGSIRSGSHLPRTLAGTFLRFPTRLRERKFWYVQALVLAATSAHYIIETSGYVNPYETLHSLAISLYIFPLVYAALSYGWEGTIFTAIWAAALTSPSTWIWHHSEFHWFGEVGQVAVTLLVGVVVAWRVEREASERRRAERTSAELSVLNDIGGMLSYTLDVEHEVPRVLRRLADGIGHRPVWLCLEAEPPDGSPSVEVDGKDSETGPLRGPIMDLDRRLKAGREPWLSDGQMVAVRLLAEGRSLGSLGVSTGAEVLDDEQRGLLLTVAAQIGVAVENARSYRQRQESLRSYARQVTRAQEEERLRISRDLHDETAQVLVQIIRKLEELKRTASEGQFPAIDDLLKVTSQELGFVRQFARDLRPPVLDVLGLPAALEILVSETNERLPDGVRLVVLGERRRLDPSIELVLFRICQEALRNTEKHGAAKSARVELRFSDELTCLEVSDDGRGFTAPTRPGDLSREGKLGLIGMRERAELIGGSFQLTSADGEGTRILVEVPAGRPVGGVGQSNP